MNIMKIKKIIVVLLQILKRLKKHYYVEAIHNLIQLLLKHYLNISHLSKEMNQKSNLVRIQSEVIVINEKHIRRVRV